MIVSDFFTSPGFTQAFWTIAIGALGAVACSLLGCFLILKRLSLLGDAISHGVLPGIVIAVLLTGQMSGPAIILGAMAFGILTAFFTETLTRVGNVTEDSSLGVVFTSLFAIGVVMISLFASGRHLDVDCVLFGKFETVSLVTDDWFGFEIPRAIPNMLLSLAMTVGVILIFWKELKLTAFDPALASAMGYSAVAVHYLFVALVAACTVTSFESMGSILVLAMLVVPPATAHLLTDRLSRMLLWAAALAFSAAAVGYLLASRWVFALNVGGMIATVAGIQFALAVAFAPVHGLAARVIRYWRLALRIAQEEILGSLYRAEEAGRTPATGSSTEHGISPWLMRLAFRSLERRGWIEPIDGRGWRLTDLGRPEAESVVRAHRLWESFLVENFSLPLDHIHAPAAVMEHFIGPQLQHELATQIPAGGVDPHGKQIP